MRTFALRALTPLFSIVLFGATAWVLHHELRAYHYRDVIGHLKGLPVSQVVLSGVFTFLSYLVLTGYDVLALRFIGRKLNYGRTAVTSFVGYVFSHNLTLLGGSAARYRIYSAWGISAFETATIVLFCGLSYWVGFLGLGMIVFLFDPIQVPAKLHLPLTTTRPLGWLFLAVMALYFLVCGWRRRPLNLRGWVFEIPSLPIAATQVTISVVDWVLGGAVLFALLPAHSEVTLGVFLQVFLLAQCAGMISHVPGGLGVFETVIVLSLGSYYPTPVILGSLVAYRGIYYLLPLALAALLLGVHEAVQRRSHVRRAIEAFGRWLPALAPRLFALTTFVGGALLLFSNATPIVGERKSVLLPHIPLGVLEAAHFLAAVIGVGLLVLSRGLQRRLAIAYQLTAYLTTAGILLSVFKGLDFEEAAFLVVLLVALVPSRNHFYRRALLISPRFNPGWVTAVVIVIAGSIWLGHFAFKHQSYTRDLWWAFTPLGDASRFLRSSFGATATLLTFAVWKWRHPLVAGSPGSAAEERSVVQQIVKASPRTYAHLALQNHMSFVLNDARSALVMYTVVEKSWMATGDPVGPDDQVPELAWRFHEQCDRQGGRTVFFAVRADHLPIYLDLGLTLLQLGNEARVSLSNAPGPYERYEFAAACRAFMGREGLRFEVMNAADPPHALACILRGDQVLARAPLWTGADQEEAAVARIELESNAPGGAMDALLLGAMDWSRQQGYRTFNLGLTPMDCSAEHELGPFKDRLGPAAFWHGEHFPDGSALLAYKAQFDPEWSPRFLACPGGLALPRVFKDLAAYRFSV